MQVDVWEISTAGLSQKAAIMLRRQLPGQRGSLGVLLVPYMEAAAVVGLP